MTERDGERRRETPEPRVPERDGVETDERRRETGRDDVRESGDDAHGEITLPELRIGE